MPNMDGTGPAGRRAGRGLGPCGCGDRRGFGRRFAQNDRPALTKEDQKKVLEAELKTLESEKQAIEARMKEIG